MKTPPYNLHLPEHRQTAVVFASPHSGRAYSADFLQASVLDEQTIRSSEDAFVDMLLGAVTSFGAPLLTANAPRAFVDLNRGAEELDPAVVEGVKSPAHNPRIASGLGVIPRVVAGSRAIYRGKIGIDEARTRILDWWHPYHDCLQRLLDESRALFGQAILIDVHSMPHEAMENIAHRPGHRPEVVVGDRYGAAAGGRVVEAVEEAFRAQGFRVARNAPFAGAYITQAYGRPVIRQHAIQIELDRSLYMDEALVAPRPEFLTFRDRLEPALQAIAEFGRGEARELAAE